MYLKRLELIGFKSFANKTVLEFPGGVTAIVGPNGSGKSNIIDALRWIMGESSAKSVRAERAEQLIFSGTTGRTRAGMAQVTITFDNSSKFFPVDFSEIVIRRKVTRDGASQYFLNESQVRAKDIVEFFSQARLGTRGLSIINQGSSDLFIKASPNERRMMMEEILGLRQYQLKRKEAELKLEHTAINLEQVNARTSELLPHLRLLRRQSAKWEKHGELARELQELENNYFAFKLRQLGKEEEALAPQVQQLEMKKAVLLKELQEREEALHSVEQSQPKGDEQFQKFRKEQQALFDRRAEIQKQLGRLEAEMEFLAKQPPSVVQEGELLKLIEETRHILRELLASEDFEAVKARLLTLSTQIEQLFEQEGGGRTEQHREIMARKETLTHELKGLEAHMKQLAQTESQLADTMRAFNTKFKQAFSEVEAKKAALTSLEQQQSRLRFDEERIELRLSDLKAQIQQAGRNVKEFVEVRPSVNLAEPAHLAEVERRIFKLRGEIAGIGEIDPALIKEAKEMEERYAFLSQQAEDLEKGAADLKKLILQLKEKIHTEFARAMHTVNEEFLKYFRLMFSGGKAKLHLVKRERPVILPETNEAGDSALAPSPEATEEFEEGGLEIEISIPRKNIKGLDMLSGGERSLISIAVLFALISVSPPPFLVLDEVDAALDENNTKRFSDLVKGFSQKTQFLIVTHNRATMNAATVLYGVTMGEDGTSRLLSLKLEDTEHALLPQKP